MLRTEENHPERAGMNAGRLKGVAICAAGVVVISPDSLLIRLIDTDVWTLTFWRGLLIALTLFVFHLVRSRPHQLVATFASLGKTGLIAGVISGVGTVLFVAAIMYTSVANTLIIIGTAPLVAALLGRFFLRESVSLSSLAAILCALIGILITVCGGLEGPRLGDLYAFGTSLCVAGYLTAVRSAGDFDMTPCIVVSGLVAALIAVPFATPAAVAASVVPYMLLLGILVLPISFGLITVGPRYLPAHEVGLILLMETVLGPYWVWLVIGENPGLAAMIGGAIVVLTLAAHTVYDLRRQPLSHWIFHARGI